MSFGRGGFSKNPGLRDFEYVVLLAFSPSVFDILQPNIGVIYLSTIFNAFLPCISKCFQPVKFQCLFTGNSTVNSLFCGSFKSFF